MMLLRHILMVMFYLTCNSTVHAANESTYTPDKVVYDLTSPDPKAIEHTLDRASVLQNFYDNDVFNASIVIVIHEDAIPFFAVRNNLKYSALTQRAASLAMAEIIEFRLCRLSAKMQGYESGDFYDFIKVIPMADAEMVQLQRAGYAYLN